MKLRTYDYQAPDGSRISRTLWDTEVCDVVNVNDKTYVLVKPKAAHGEAPNALVKNEAHLARTLPRSWQGAGIEKVWSKFTPVDPETGGGIAIVEGKRDRQELEARLKSLPGYAAGYEYDRD